MEEQEASFEDKIRRIRELKEKRSLNSIKKTDNGTKRNIDFLLDIPPMNNANWLGICSADNYCRRYITYGPVIYDSKENKQLKILNDKIKEIVERVNREYIGIQDYVPDRPTSRKTIQGKQLWIEKYEPKNFMDLLTDNKVNRIGLCWLNLWNEYIFNAPSVHSKLSEYEQSILEIEGKNPCMPKKKIMMIHGSVGCGKTSLAMMLANIRYDPFVINMRLVFYIASLAFKCIFSEITSVNELKRVLILSSNYHAVNFTPKSRKPRCLIIDGIEYATTEIVSTLLKWTTEGKKKNALRPIICTCNNLYVPALRDLRSNAFLLKATVDGPRLLERVQDICLKENVSASKLTLKSLVDGSNSDIRLCINTLQFQCDSAYSDTTAKDLDVNHKSEMSIFEALEVVLTLNRHKNKMGSLLSPRERSQQVSTVVNSRSDVERFTELVFHNIPPICKPIKKIAQNSTDLSEGDIIQTMVNLRHDYTLMKYCSNSLIKTHFDVAKLHNRRLNLSINPRWKECQNAAQSRYSSFQNDMIDAITKGDNVRQHFRSTSFLDKPNLMIYDKDEYAYQYGSFRKQPFSYKPV